MGGAVKVHISGRWNCCGTVKPGKKDILDELGQDVVTSSLNKNQQDGNLRGSLIDKVDREEGIDLKVDEEGKMVPGNVKVRKG